MSRADKTRMRAAAARHRIEQERLAVAAAMREREAEQEREIEKQIYPALLDSIDEAASNGHSHYSHLCKAEIELRLIAEKLRNDGYTTDCDGLIIDVRW